MRIVVHGGAGAIAPERHARVLAGIRAAAERGAAMLRAGAAALDAVEAAVRVLEDDPEFNAGIGSALARDGTVETDASIMCGHTRRIGAVAAVPELGNAVALARAVMDAGEHAILAGPAALEFAREVGIVAAPTGSLVTDRMRARLALRLGDRERDGGTVGAVACDRDGRLAAATSTGGIVGKRRGRVGDSPIPGAGTWADAHVAISATGDGEAILRVALAKSIACAVAIGVPLDRAVRDGLAELASITGGCAGVIALDRSTHATLQLSPVMPVAWAISDDNSIETSLGYQV